MQMLIILAAMVLAAATPFLSAPGAWERDARDAFDQMQLPDAADEPDDTTGVEDETT